MKNFRREISRQLLNTTVINKRKFHNTKKSPTEIKKFKPTVPDYVRLEKSAHQPKVLTWRRCSTKKKKWEQSGCIPYVIYIDIDRYT